MVLTWWKIWCPPHLNDFGAPWWMVYFPSWILVPSLFFWDSLAPHKNSNAKSSISLVWPYLGICMVPFFYTNFWYIPSFLIGFTCFLITTWSPVSNSLMSLSLLPSSLCLILLLDTRMLNRSIFINRSGDAASK